jgi:hypothetical protein
MVNPVDLSLLYGHNLIDSTEHPPAIALFATNGRYKREAYRASEFAPRILADNGLNVVMKVMQPRYCLHSLGLHHIEPN